MTFQLHTDRPPLRAQLTPSPPHIPGHLAEDIPLFPRSQKYQLFAWHWHRPPVGTPQEQLELSRSRQEQMYGTPNGLPLAQFPQDKKTQEKMSLSDHLGQLYPDWHRVLEILHDRQSPPLEWHCYRLYYQARQILSMYQCRYDSLTSRDQDREVMEWSRLLASNNAYLPKLLNLILKAHRTVILWRDIPSVLVAVRVISLSLSSHTAPGRPVRRSMVNGEPHEYQLPLSVTYNNNDWLSRDDRYHPCAVFPQQSLRQAVQIMKLLPVPKIHFPGHHFAMARYAQWARPLLIVNYPDIAGGVAHLVQSFRTPNALNEDDNYGRPYYLEPTAAPAWMTNTQFIKPVNIGYEKRLDPYHLQKHCFFNLEYYDAYHTYIPELEYLILGAPQQLLLGGRTVVQYWKHLRNYGLRHRAHLGTWPKMHCLAFYLDNHNYGCPCGSMPFTLQELAGRTILRFVVHQAQDMNPYWSLRKGAGDDIPHTDLTHLTAQQESVLKSCRYQPYLVKADLAVQLFDKGIYQNFSTRIGMGRGWEDTMESRVPEDQRIFLRYLLGSGQCLYAFDDSLRKGGAPHSPALPDYTNSPWVDGPGHPDPEESQAWDDHPRCDQFEGPFSGHGTPGQHSDCYCTMCDNRYEKLLAKRQHMFYSSAWVWERKKDMNKMLDTVGDLECKQEWNLIKETRLALHRRRVLFPGTMPLKPEEFLDQMIELRHRSDWVLAYLYHRLDIIENYRKHTIRKAQKVHRVTFTAWVKEERKNRDRAFPDHMYVMNQLCTIREVVTNPLNRFLKVWMRIGRRPTIVEARAQVGTVWFHLEARQEVGWQYLAHQVSGPQWEDPAWREMFLGLPIVKAHDHAWEIVNYEDIENLGPVIVDVQGSDSPPRANSEIITITNEDSE